MNIHKEGILTLAIVFVVIIGINYGVSLLTRNMLIEIITALVTIPFFLLLVWFFRSPSRPVVPDETSILCPADGKVVAIEKTFEKEYFNDERWQISIFMSPLNVHVNRYPITGEVTYFKYHPGKYLVAWHPKSSELNERATFVMKNSKSQEILVRQIAGAVARRIVSYAKEGDLIVQGDELGFIKFGSRVDIFLPLDAEIRVKLNQRVTGNVDVIALWK
ncbi:MAG: phosphatidylserine decarboxylase family protein [Bacteroidales bacterium]|nr:phosphatidylserine decarboxylase family protein [Bacteroidales bacterium]